MCLPSVLVIQTRCFMTCVTRTMRNRSGGVIWGGDAPPGSALFVPWSRAKKQGVRGPRAPAGAGASERLRLCCSQPEIIEGSQYMII